MDGGRWRRLNEVFHEVLAVDPGERPAAIARLCAGDEAFRRDVEELLAAHQHAELDSAAFERVTSTWDESPSALVGRRFGPYRGIGILAAVLFSLF